MPEFSDIFDISDAGKILYFQRVEIGEIGKSRQSDEGDVGVLTNLGVFMPVALMSSIAGQFLKPYAVTIVYATLFSLWVTMTVTPCLAAHIHPTQIGRASCRERV